MDNREIRYRILNYLFQKNFSKDLGRPQAVETIIKELGLDDKEGMDRDVIYANVVYLNKSGLIEGMNPNDYSYPPYVIITNYGIDFVENVDNSLIEQEPAQFETLKNENNSKIRAKKVLEVINRNPGVINTLVNILSKLMG